MKTRDKILLASCAQRLVMAARYAVGAGPIAVVRRQGVMWRLDLREGIDFSIFLLGAFERRTLRCYRALLKPGDTVIDIGANIGAHSLPLAQAVGPSGRLIAVEPTGYAFEKLRANFLLNPELNHRALLRQWLLTAPDDQPGPAALYASWPLRNARDLHDGHRGRLQSTAGARVTTVDEGLRELKLTSVALVKLDVDGFECKVLKGATSLLRCFRPAFLLELSPYVLKEHGGTLSEFLDLFRAAGYRFYALDRRTPVAMSEQVLQQAIPEGGGCNVVAVAET